MVSSRGVISGAVCAFIIVLAAEADNQFVQLVLGFVAGVVLDTVVHKYVVRT